MLRLYTIFSMYLNVYSKLDSAMKQHGTIITTNDPYIFQHKQETIATTFTVLVAHIQISAPLQHYYGTIKALLQGRWVYVDGRMWMMRCLIFDHSFLFIITCSSVI